MLGVDNFINQGPQAPTVIQLLVFTQHRPSSKGKGHVPCDRVDPLRAFVFPVSVCELPTWCVLGCFVFHSGVVENNQACCSFVSRRWYVAHYLQVKLQTCTDYVLPCRVLGLDATPSFPTSGGDSSRGGIGEYFMAFDQAIRRVVVSSRLERERE